MGAIQLKAVEKWFGNQPVIRGIDLAIRDGELIVFVGPSGCGKSTLLRMIGGLEQTSRGAIILDGRDVTEQPPAQRGLSMVFQSYALYPHMSARDNMGFSLKTAGAPKAEIAARVNAAARILKLEPLLDRRPKDMSGGQRQRVAIGRSIVRAPTAFLFDEPLSNLDAALRADMRLEIAKLRQTLQTTMIYVTHDQVEAMTLADRIVVLDAGRVAQVGTPRELYDHPADLFVAQFIGSPKMNILPCDGPDNTFGPAPGQAVHLGIRPEHIAPGAAGSGDCDGKIMVVEYLGADSFLFVDCGPAGVINVRVGGGENYRPGQTVGLTFQPNRLHFFDATGKVRCPGPVSGLT